MSDENNFIPQIWMDLAQNSWDLHEEVSRKPLPETGQVWTHTFTEPGMTMVDIYSLLDRIPDHPQVEQDENDTLLTLDITPVEHKL
jgi:hypothetical protein